MPIINLVFVVCHPDDEALGIGGTIHGLSQISGIKVHVICLSGRDENSPRVAEFDAAMKVAGYESGVVLGGALRPANQPLPSISQAVKEGMVQLGLQISEVSLLVTHSPFGEEHMHPHHIQSSIELYQWARDQRLPFGFFACLPIPTCSLQPLLKNMKRKGALQLLNFAKCRMIWYGRLIRICVRKPYRYPNYYVQFLTDGKVKQEMLSCYASIDLQLHEEGYAMFHNNCESFYLFDKCGVNVIKYIMQQMEVPGSVDYFLGSWTLFGLITTGFDMINRLNKKLFHRKN